MRFLRIFLCFLLGGSFVLCQQEVQQLLELFYEETGKTKRIDEVEIFSKYKIELTQDNVQKVADLLAVNRKIATRIISMSKRGITFEEICDSLNLLTSQCELLKLCTRQAVIAHKGKNTGFRSQSSDLSIELRSRFYTNFSKDTSFLGDAIDSYQRLKVQYKSFSTGISISKDIGEQSFLNNYKFFFSYDNPNYRIVLGSFVFKSFWGNILGEPYGVYKGSNPVAVSFSNATKLRPTTSSLDWGTFNGIAISSNLNLSENISFGVSGFISLTKRSGNFDTLMNKFTSIYTMGYFRDSVELKKKDNLKENSFFLQLTSTFGLVTVGYSIFNVNYDKFIETSSKKFILGRTNFYQSLFCDIDLGKSLNFSTEFDFDKEKNCAIVSGCKYSAKSFATTLNIRYFSKDFRSPFGSMLGENSYPNNEFGIFYAFEIGQERFKVQFYSDFFKSLSSTTLLQVPYRGNDVFIQLLLKPMDKSILRFRIRREQKTDYTYNQQKTYQIPYQKIKYQFLAENNIEFLNIFSSTQRFDFVYLDKRNFVPNETGFHTSVDLSCQILTKSEVGIRVNYFSTTSYSSAIYFFEVVAPEYFYSFPFYGTGWRFAFWTKVNLLNSFDVYFKYYWQSNARNRNFLIAQLNFNYFF